MQNNALRKDFIFHAASNQQAASEQNTLTSTHSKVQSEPSGQQSRKEKLLGHQLSNRTRESIQTDAARLARFGANITDAHSCFLFLTSEVFSDTVGEPVHASENDLFLLAHHTLSTDINTDCRIDGETGFLGWGIRNGRALHISPFERDSRCLDVYLRDQKLKSLLALPFWIESGLTSEDASRHGNEQTKTRRPDGMIVCDSKKAFSFSKLQQKLLSDLSVEVANVISLHIEKEIGEPDADGDLDQFFAEAMRLNDQLGTNALELFRVSLDRLRNLEKSLKFTEYTEKLGALPRLLRQSVPTSYPMLQLPNGDIVFLIDHMYHSLFRSRLDAIIEHTVPNKDLDDMTPHTKLYEVESQKLKRGFFRKKIFEEAFHTAWENVSKRTREGCNE